jgi:hypothetical protein
MPARDILPAFAAVLLFAVAPPPAAAVSGDGTEPRNMSFEEPAPDKGPPPGWWFVQHAGPPSFEFALDDQVAQDGRYSLRIRRTGAEPFGLVMQRIRADRFRAKRARLTAFLCLDHVEAYGPGVLREMSGAVLMLRSQGAGILTLEDMRDRPLRGTKPWTEVSVEIDVPEAASIIEFGAELSGSGTMWADAFTLEVIESLPAQETTRN